MIIFKQAAALSHHILQAKTNGQQVGFVPTMGALHQGHLSLITASSKHNNLTVCSIFVNPTQFTNAEDFEHYPVTIEKDIEKLVLAGCDILFLPAVSEIYPPGYQSEIYALGALETILEGEFRPGHFQGVCQVVDRLLSITTPNRLYMGQKDYQQCMVVKTLVQLTGKKNIELHFEPTLREADGLAMSSRNVRLNRTERFEAVAIWQALQQIKEGFAQGSLPVLCADAATFLKAHGFTVDYVTVRRASDLQPYTATDRSTKAVALIAATIGSIRLIDNLLLN